MRKPHELRSDHRMSSSGVWPSTSADHTSRLSGAGIWRSNGDDRPRAKSSHVLAAPSNLSGSWKYCNDNAVHDDEPCTLTDSSHPYPSTSPRRRTSLSWAEFNDGVRLRIRRASLSLKSALTTKSTRSRSFHTADSSVAVSLRGATCQLEPRAGSSVDKLSHSNHSIFSTSCPDPVHLAEKLPLSDSVHPLHAAITQPPAYGRAARTLGVEYAERLESLHLADSSTLGDPPSYPYGVLQDSESGISLPSSENLSRVDSKSDLASPFVTLLKSRSPFTTPSDPVTNLPAELVSEIFALLDFQSLTRAESVSRAWREVASSPHVWRQVFLQRYEPATSPASLPLANGGLGIGKPSKPEREWKRMYKLRMMLDARWHNDEGVAIYLKGHTDGVYCVQYDEKKIITGSRDRTIRVWDMETFQCTKVIGSPQTAETDQRHHELSIYTQHLAEHPSTVSSSRILPIDPAAYHTPSSYHSASILCLQYDDEILVTGSSDRTLIVWDMATWEPIHRLHGHTHGVLDIAFDKHKIVSCSKDTTICIWDRTTGTLLQQLSGHRGPVNAVQLRGNLVVSASGDGAKLWDVAIPGQAKCVKEFCSQCKGLACIEFSPDARYLIAGGNNQVIYKYDTTTGALVTTMTGHRELVRSLYLDTANGRIVSGSYDMSLKVWDFATGQRIGTGYESWTTSWMLSAKCDYRRIVGTSQDGRALIIDFGRDAQGKLLDGLDLLEGV